MITQKDIMAVDTYLLFKSLTESLCEIGKLSKTDQFKMLISSVYKQHDEHVAIEAKVNDFMSYVENFECSFETALAHSIEYLKLNDMISFQLNENTKFGNEVHRALGWIELDNLTPKSPNIHMLISEYESNWDNGLQAQFKDVLTTLFTDNYKVLKTSIYDAVTSSLELYSNTRQHILSKDPIYQMTHADSSTGESNFKMFNVEQVLQNRAECSMDLTEPFNTLKSFLENANELQARRKLKRTEQLALFIPLKESTTELITSTLAGHTDNIADISRILSDLRWFSAQYDLVNVQLNRYTNQNYAHIDSVYEQAVQSLKALDLISSGMFPSLAACDEIESLYFNMAMYRDILNTNIVYMGYALEEDTGILMYNDTLCNSANYKEYLSAGYSEKDLMLFNTEFADSYRSLQGAIRETPVIKDKFEQNAIKNKQHCTALEFDASVQALNTLTTQIRRDAKEKLSYNTNSQLIDLRQQINEGPIDNQLYAIHTDLMCGSDSTTHQIAKRLNDEYNTVLATKKDITRDEITRIDMRVLCDLATEHFHSKK